MKAIREGGFTIVEMIITLIVMSVFLMFFFQSFLAAQSQHTAVVRLSSANDIAMANLHKFAKKVDLPVVTCDSSTNLVTNASAPGAPVTFTQESLSSTNLPSTTTQEVRAFYPQGCDPNMPVLLQSKVMFGTETVTHATYIN